MEVIQKELLPQVHLTAVCTQKFKSSRLSVSLLAPMDRQTVTANALLPSVLRRGSEQYPDNSAISARLDNLYGGTLEASVTQKGNIQSVGLTGSFLDDSYSLDGSPILEDAADLMGQLLLHPVLENGTFRPEYVSGEGKNLSDAIQAEINEKRLYAVKRLRELMYRDDPCGLDKLGFADEAVAIFPEQLWERYRALLASAPISLYYCGTAPAARVEEILLAALADLPDRSDILSVSPSDDAAPEVTEVHSCEDVMDVTQCNLAMGWRTGGINIYSEDYPALSVLNAVFGGTSTSKLFMNVRERLSLCYYASSSIDSLKGSMVVSSGVEYDHVEEARQEILSQFEACASGDFTDEELEAARQTVISNLKACLDNQGTLASYWSTRSVAGLDEGPEELGRRIGAVTAPQVAEAAQKLKLDTVYLLRGEMS